MTLAVTGRIGWDPVLPLPFELAALPQSWFGALQLPVVSYALPALIAIGQTIHHHAPSKNPIARVLRNSVKTKTLARLDKLQPPNGGFLEATPLTAFVTMSLASMGLQNHSVAQRGASFLKNSIRPDGSWPIDTNLATWVTTLSVKALSHQRNALPPKQAEAIRTWLLTQQYQVKHPYTGAAPGGWAWTDLPGGVPDADDTAGALIALSHLNERPSPPIEAGLTWLLNIQNRDGGIPTFCRGWGTLPFDRSSPELTIHAMEAWHRWQPAVDGLLAVKIDRALSRAKKFLAASQRQDGAWIPLWFGNENAPEQENAVYGTSRTLIGLNELNSSNAELRTRAATFLQNSTAPEYMEETALALEATNDPRRLNHLLDLVESDAFTPAPIGLYFARLWYYEKLYPLIFATGALGRIASQKL
jgi:squalene-hopene/tetraprenyl-beta-curcumene cyclase